MVRRVVFFVGLLALCGLALTGCPREESEEYNLGFQAGYAQEDWYWRGYYDSWNSEGFEDFYEGDEIPNPSYPEFDEGYWDGVWTIYNEGYYDAYMDAFEIGFERGYGRAFFSGWEQFLMNDEHVEYGTGGFDDGYNDGYTVGTIWGAWDYVRTPFMPDWERALRSEFLGVRVCVPVGVWTLCNDSVPLYEYGTVPW